MFKKICVFLFLNFCFYNVNAQVGFLGTTFHKEKPTIVIENENKVGFMGTDFNKFDLHIDKNYITPIGYFGNYIGKNIYFPALSDTVSNSPQKCTDFKPIPEIDVTLKNRGYTDYLELKWDEIHDYNVTGIKLIRNYPNYKEINLNIGDTSYIDYLIFNENNYSYNLVFTYNCGGIQRGGDKIFNYTYSYFGELEGHRLFSQAYLGEDEAINFLINGKLSQDEIFEEYYYLYPQIDGIKNLNYENTSLLFLNILGQEYITHPQIAFDLFENLGIYYTGTNRYDLVSGSEFIKIYEKIINNDFKNDITNNIDNVFTLTNEEKAREYLFIYNLEDDFFSCFELNGCKDKKSYLQFKLKNISKTHGENIDLLVPNMNTVDNSRDNNIYILYSIFGKDKYNYGELSISEYRKFIRQLPADFLSEKSGMYLNYYDYNRIKMLLIESGLKNKIFEG